jgi:indolepyruvate ferredoxin oxidoreductase alpha subunit
VVIEDLARSLGIPNVHVTDPTANPAAFQDLVAACLASGGLSVIVARRNCLLAAGKIKEYERAAAEQIDSCSGEGGGGLES